MKWLFVSYFLFNLVVDSLSASSSNLSCLIHISNEQYIENNAKQAIDFLNENRQRGLDQTEIAEETRLLVSGPEEIKKTQKNTKRSFRVVKDKYLKNLGIDAHEVKGKIGANARHDLYVDKKTGELVVFLKGAKGSPERTNIFIWKENFSDLSDSQADKIHRLKNRKNLRKKKRERQNW